MHALKFYTAGIDNVPVKTAPALSQLLLQFTSAVDVWYTHSGMVVHI